MTRTDVESFLRWLASPTRRSPFEAPEHFAGAVRTWHAALEPYSRAQAFDAAQRWNGSERGRDFPALADLVALLDAPEPVHPAPPEPVHSARETWHTVHAEWAEKWPGGCPEPSPSIAALDRAIAELPDAGQATWFDRALEILREDPCS